jgi:hypothetical protein
MRSFYCFYQQWLWWYWWKHRAGSGL